MFLEWGWLPGVLNLLERFTATLIEAAQVAIHWVSKSPLICSSTLRGMVTLRAEHASLTPAMGASPSSGRAER